MGEFILACVDLVLLGVDAERTPSKPRQEVAH